MFYNLKYIARAQILAATTMAAICSVSSSADAAVTVNIGQVGTSVVATVSGALDLTGLTSYPNGYTLVDCVNAASGYVSAGTSGSRLDGYSGFPGPTSFGSGGFTNATSGTGTSFAIDARDFGPPVAFLQAGYVSGSAITSTLTFANSTFASLGLTTGSYKFTSTNDSILVNIGQAATPGAVPEPATWAMMIAGFGMVGFAMRRRQQVATRVSHAV